MEEKLQQLTTEIQAKFGSDSTKMFSILILMVFMDTSKWEIPDYMKSIPELKDYINFLENNELLKEIFKSNT